MFQAAAWLISQFYNLTSDYSAAIALVAVVIMMLIFPLTLKSTKSMLEMQRVQPEMRRLQNQYRNDRQKLNEEMMKLYQEHKVNPLASCLPMLAQMPIFLIMFRVLHGLSNKTMVDGVEVIQPDYISKTSKLYESLNGAKDMMSLGIDLSLTPVKAIQDSPGKGVIYALLVIALMGLYFVQQRMIASRTVSPGMSATQAKIMQYLPVAFGVFQFFSPSVSWCITSRRLLCVSLSSNTSPAASIGVNTHSVSRPKLRAPKPENSRKKKAHPADSSVR